jgi:hypothetical protein
MSSGPTPVFRKFNHDERSCFQGERLNNHLLQYVGKIFAERSKLMIAILNVVAVLWCSASTSRDQQSSGQAASQLCSFRA